MRRLILDASMNFAWAEYEKADWFDLSHKYNAEADWSAIADRMSALPFGALMHLIRDCAIWVTSDIDGAIEQVRQLWLDSKLYLSPIGTLCYGGDCCWKHMMWLCDINTVLTRMELYIGDKLEQWTYDEEYYYRAKYFMDSHDMLIEVSEQMHEYYASGKKPSGASWDFIVKHCYELAGMCDGISGTVWAAISAPRTPLYKGGYE